MTWGPRKPKERMKVVECGAARWEDHGLDYPHEMITTNFKITGEGHRRIESIYTDCCHDRAARGYACSFVLFDTQPRRTVIGFERPDDAAEFRAEFVR